MEKPKPRRETMSFERAPRSERAKEAPRSKRAKEVLGLPYTAEEGSDALTKPKASFLSDLTSLINKHSLEGGSNTADYILADYLSRCLENFDLTIQARSNQTHIPITKKGV